MTLKDTGLFQVKVQCWPTEKGEEIRLIKVAGAGTIIRDENTHEQSKSWDLGTAGKVVGTSSLSNEVIEEALLELIDDDDFETKVSHDTVFLDKRWWDLRVVEWVNIVLTIQVELSDWFQRCLYNLTTNLDCVDDGGVIGIKLLSANEDLDFQRE